jgi:hypothetical protein
LIPPNDARRKGVVDFSLADRKIAGSGGIFDLRPEAARP